VKFKIYFFGYVSFNTSCALTFVFEHSNKENVLLTQMNLQPFKEQKSMAPSALNIQSNKTFEDDHDDGAC